MFYMEVSHLLANRIKLEHSYAAVSDCNIEIKQEIPQEISVEDINSINTEIDLGVVTKAEIPSDDCSQLSAYCDLPSGSEHPTELFVSGTVAGRQNNKFSVTTELKSNSVLSLPHLGIRNDYTLLLPIHYKLNLKHLKDLNVKLMKRAYTAEKQYKETKQQMTLLQKNVLKLGKELTKLRHRESESRRHVRKRQDDMDKKHAQTMKFRKLMLSLKQRELKVAKRQIAELRKLLLAERASSLKYSKQTFARLQAQKAEVEKASVKLKNALDVTRTCLVKEMKECKSYKMRAHWLAARLKLKEKEIASKDVMIKKNVEAYRTKICQYCGF